MIVSSKSGTNTVHGSMYDFFRNRLLNDRNVFQTTKSTAKYVQKRSGIHTGRPGGDSQSLRRPQQRRSSSPISILTLRRTGISTRSSCRPRRRSRVIFSQTFSGGKLVTIYDPGTSRQDASGNTILRDPFPGNRIPVGRLTGLVLPSPKFFPDPNGVFQGGFELTSVQPSQTRQTWQWLERVDHNFGSNDRMFARIGGYNPNTDAQARIPSKANKRYFGRIPRHAKSW